MSRAKRRAIFSDDTCMIVVMNLKLEAMWKLVGWHATTIKAKILRNVGNNFFCLCLVDFLKIFAFIFLFEHKRTVIKYTIMQLLCFICLSFLSCHLYITFVFYFRRYGMNLLNDEITLWICIEKESIIIKFYYKIMSSHSIYVFFLDTFFLIFAYFDLTV